MYSNNSVFTIESIVENPQINTTFWMFPYQVFRLVIAAMIWIKGPLVDRS